MVALVSTAIAVRADRLGLHRVLERAETFAMIGYEERAKPLDRYLPRH